MEKTASRFLEEPDHFFLIWHKPFPGVDKEGAAPVQARVTLRASVQDCILMARHALHSKKWPRGKTYPNESDLDLLLDFIAVNWATAEYSLV